LELAVAPWVADETGLHVESAQEVVRHVRIPWAFSTVDAELYESPGSAPPVGNLEIKTRQPGPDEPPTPDVVAQCLWQQFCGGYSARLVAILRGRRLDLHWIERDDDEISWILDRVDQFWHQHVATGTPPEVDGSDATKAALSVVYGDVESGSYV